ncbi:MAG: polysaccharide deacetylase family protein [Dehalococcoidia bacterium]|nr:polysaccharide deacetylase family protein [Dehalococcoidia bacterium]
MPPVIPKEENGNRKLVTSLDIFASTFFLLTRYEEVVSGGPLDEHDRFPASSSVLLKWNLLHRPLVNEYAELLKDWIRRVAPIFKFHDRNYRGHKFAVAVTRDIDAIRKYPRFPVRGIGGNILRRKIREAIQVASEATAIHVLRRRDPYDNLREILKWEKQIGIRSSIYLMASRGQRDASYDLTELTWNRKAILQSMLDGGWEIGFHPGYWTHGNEEAFQQQLATLRKQVSKTFGAEDGAIIGGRQHFLRFRPPYTWRIWEKAGLKYDSTLAFADHEGFRCGTCVPYKPFDVLDRREIDIWEVPLTVMDCTLDRYRGLSPQEAEETMDRLLEQVKKHRGVFVLLWHNSCFGRENSGPYHDVVARFITKALEEDAYVGPIRDVLFCLSEKFVD